MIHYATSFHSLQPFLLGPILFHQLYIIMTNLFTKDNVFVCVLHVIIGLKPPDISLESQQYSQCFPHSSKVY